MASPLIPRRLKFLSYNIHSGVGKDGRYDLTRIRRILEEEQPDVAAIQEIERQAQGDQLNELATAVNAESSFCATRPAGDGSFGLAVLSRLRVLQSEHYDLGYGRSREPRYCMRTDIEIEPGLALHVFNCHLGLAMRERRFQRDRMLSEAILLSRDLLHPVILMGDFNDSPIPVVHPKLRRHFEDVFRAAGGWWGPTFRAGIVPIRLDRIYVSPQIRALQCSVRNDSLAKVASDHLPVIATLEIHWP